MGLRDKASKMKDVTDTGEPEEDKKKKKPSAQKADGEAPPEETEPEPLVIKLAKEPPKKKEAKKEAPVKEPKAKSEPAAPAKGASLRRLAERARSEVEDVDKLKSQLAAFEKEKAKLEKDLAGTEELDSMLKEARSRIDELEG
ncbi:MAG: hypothetical protein KAQ96_07375, partial [Thermoplasmata archaeon]|nr:hypothetical protein [Thermoplasmata archaeon]